MKLLHRFLAATDLFLVSPMAQALSLASCSRSTLHGPSSMARWLKGVPTRRLWKKTKVPEKSQRKRSGPGEQGCAGRPSGSKGAKSFCPLFEGEVLCQARSLQVGVCSWNEKTWKSLVFPRGCRKSTIPRPKQCRSFWPDALLCCRWGSPCDASLAQLQSKRRASRSCMILSPLLVPWWSSGCSMRSKPFWVKAHMEKFCRQMPVW